MGIFIDGGEACAIVAPSTNVTMEWTMDCGCTVTSMMSGEMPKSSVASINSRPLFTIVAEFRVFICPIDHVGCAAACAGVASHICSRVCPRKGPPEAVSTKRSTSSAWPARKHCAIAECSESTGTISPPRAITMSPPATRDSLFASASTAPLSKVASVEARPNEPTSAFNTTSA